MGEQKGGSGVSPDDSGMSLPHSETAEVRRDAETTLDTDTGEHRRDAETTPNSNTGEVRRCAETTPNSDMGEHRRDAETTSNSDTGEVRRCAETTPNSDMGEVRRDAETTPDSDTAEVRRDAETTLETTQEATIVKRQGFFLPHWTKEGAIYHVVFRLRDCLPRDVLLGFQRERDQLKRQASRGELPKAEAERLDYLVSERVEAYLDAGHGECLMKTPSVADIVANAIKHFDGERYALHAWAVMPNHVHVIVEPFTSHKLDKITHSWKSFTAHEINKLLKRTGEVWMKECYDHLIRNEGSYHALVQYVLDNPVKGKLECWKWVGGGSGVPPT